MTFVFFDAGGTLLEAHPSVGAVYARAGRAHGLTASADALDAAFKQAWGVHVAREGREVLDMGRDEPSTRAWWRALVDRVFDDVGFDRDRDACFTAFFDAFASTDAWRVFDDTRPTLEALRARGIGAGVLSNWDYRLPVLLDALALTPYFDPILVSSIVGMSKPDPAFFVHAAERVGRAPSEIVYVGDHVDLDLEPALAIGMRAYLIDRRGRHAGDRVITSLAALLDAVDG
ncbi:HAD-IA family hydrolase [Myxococcota bacterium]|nr:HAD-IA family hydrolase [Myxococcota bacterium]